MNTAVLFFFLNNVLATLLLGVKFATKKDKTLRNFGIALLFDTVAFAIWSVAVALKPENLETYVTVGVAFFIISLVFFLVAGIQSLDPKKRQMLTLIGIILGIIALYVRAFVYPSAPSFSPEGFFFFNPHPVVRMFYIFGLILATVPAIDAASLKFKMPHGALFRYGFLAEVAGGIVLLTSNITNPDTLALNMTGWIIGLVYLYLWIKFVCGRKAWS